MGPTLPPRIMANLAILDYEGASFVFKFTQNIDASSLMTTENTLAKITISCDHNSIIDRFKRGKLSCHLLPIVRILLDEGIEIYTPNNPETNVSLYFGDHKLEVLRILGNPSKEFYDGGNLFLNYLDLGLDI